MLVRCIDNNRGHFDLTIGKVYKATEITSNMYWLHDDLNRNRGFNKYHFEVVNGPSIISTEPTKKNKDIWKHHKKQEV